MANLIPVPGWDDVFQIEVPTPVLGGAGGPSNYQAQALLNRTEFLMQQVGSLGINNIDPMVLTGRQNSGTGKNDWLNIVGNTALTISATPSYPLIYSVYNGIINNKPSLTAVVLQTAVTLPISGITNGNYYVYLKYNPPSGAPALNTEIKLVAKDRLFISNININDDEALELRKSSGEWYELPGGGSPVKVGVCIIGEVTVSGGQFTNLILYPIRTPFYNSSIPAGTIMDYAGSGAPIGGWLRCDGQTYVRSQYADLFNIIGTTYGTSTSTDFKVPDTRGLFVRDLSSGSTIDSGRTIGTIQNDSLREHTHTIGGISSLSIVTESGIGTGDLAIVSGSVNDYTSGQGNNTIDNTGDIETRPINIALAKYIKF